MKSKANKPLSDIAELEAAFSNKDLFHQALTHRSWLNENSETNGNNERLEFLGDAVLEFVVSAHLYRNMPDKEEGFLTALRANIVNTRNLAVVAQALHVGRAIKLSKGEELGHGRENESLLADTMEAIIGALYLDRGLVAVEDFILSHLLSDLEDKLALPLKDAKSRLQEAVQADGLPAPRYQVVQESGPDHDRIFEVAVNINGGLMAQGSGSSKNRAEQEAAEAALVKMGQNR